MSRVDVKQRTTGPGIHQVTATLLIIGVEIGHKLDQQTDEGVPDQATDPEGQGRETDAGQGHMSGIRPGTGVPQSGPTGAGLRTAGAGRGGIAAAATLRTEAARAETDATPGTATDDALVHNLGTGTDTETETSAQMRASEETFQLQVLQLRNLKRSLKNW